MNFVENVVKRLRESRENRAEYVCKSIVVDNKGVMEIHCYDTVEDEEFDKWIGQVEDPSARKNARLLLKDPKFEVPKDIKNELIGTFGLEDFGFRIEESEGSQYLSSFDRDVMRAVNNEAPSALHWRNGITVTNTKTGEKAQFLGYKKDFHGNYRAAFSSDDEEFDYRLPELQRDIKNKVIVISK